MSRSPVTNEADAVKLPTIAYSTVGFREGNLPAALASIAEAGFRHIELAVNPHAVGPPSGGDAVAIRRLIESHGLTASTMHGPLGHWSLGTPTPQWHREKTDSYAEYLNFAGDLGVAGMVIHPIVSPNLLPETDVAGQLDALLTHATQALEQLIPVAAATNVRILLENLPYQVQVVDYPLINMTQLRRFILPYPADQVGLVVDVGHAWTSGIDPVQEIETAGDRLWGTHLQDVDADHPADNHWVPGHGGLDFSAIRDALNRIDYRGVWTFEVVVPRHGEKSIELAHLTRQMANQWLGLN